MKNVNNSHVSPFIETDLRKSYKHNKRYIFKSTDRISGSINSGICKSNEILEEGLYKILEFSFTNSLYNVNSYNNTLKIDEYTVSSTPITSYTITLTKGSYSYSSLATHLQTQLNASLSGNITVTYSSSTGKYTIVNDTNDMKIKYSGSTCLTLIGFNDSSDSSQSTSLTSDNVADLISIKNIYCIIAEDKTKDIFDIDSFRASCYFFDKDSTFGDLFKCINSDDFGNRLLNLGQTKQITYQLFDQNQNQIELSTEWIMILENINLND